MDPADEGRVMRRYLMLLLAAGLFLGACGDDDTADEASDDTADEASDDTADDTADEASDDTADGDLVAAIAESMQIPDEPGEPLPTADEAQCAAEAIVGAIGTDRLNELGVTPENVPTDLGEVGFDSGEVETVVTLQFGCYDFVRLIAEGLAVGGVSEESALCVAAALPEDLILAAGIAEGNNDEVAGAAADEALFEALSDAAPDCLTAEELELVGLG